MQWAQDLAGIGREKQKKFFEYALRLAREYFVLNMHQDDLVYLNNQEAFWGERFSPFINERNIVRISSEFELAYQHISMNGNPRIIFLDIALKMAKLIKK